MDNRDKLTKKRVEDLKNEIKSRLKEEIIEEVKEKDTEEIKNEIQNVTTEEEAKALIEDYNIVDFANGFDEVDKDNDLLRFFRLLDVENQALILEESNEDLQFRIVELLEYDEIIKIFEYMSPDDVTDILGELEFNKSKSILNQMKRSDANKFRELLGYAEDTAGGIMTTRFIAFKSNLKVSEVMEKIKIIAPKTEYIETVFILDSKKELIGEVDLRDILTSDSNTKLIDIMQDNVIYVSATDDQEKVAQLVSKYGLKVIPVVNNKKNLLGIITIDDIIDVIQEENTEDILRMSGVSDEEAIDSSLYEIVKKRLPWLIINLGTAFVASFTVGLFSDTIDKVVALAIAMPIVSGMGGNAGTQSLAVTIRTIALDNMNEEKAKSVLKYLFVGMINGACLGILCGVIIYFMFSNIILSLIIFISMIGNCVIACIVGYLIPIILKSIKIDPAMASSVILTTITDTLGFFQFLGLATLFLNKLI